MSDDNEDDNDNVVEFRDPYMAVDVDPDAVLLSAMKELDSCVIMGTTKSGKLYLTSSRMDMREIIFLMETMKIQMLLGQE